MTYNVLALEEFGNQLILISGFAKSFKYKTNFPLSQMPKSVVVAFGNWLYNLIVI
jgi:hypothetical protein